MQYTTWKQRALPRTRLAAGMALALGVAGFGVQPNVDARATWPEAAPAGPREADVPARPATTYEVTSCADDGTAGTLRYVIEHAGDGDTADLGSLSCSAITLASGEILLPMNNFSIVAAQPVTIDAGGTSRVFEHDGVGTLYLKDINAVNGYFKYNTATAIPKGGCILSDGLVVLSTSSVSGCGLVNTLGQVRGGGIYASTGIHAYEYSGVANNTASGVSAIGGGAYSFGSVYFQSSSVSGNSALAVTGATGAVIEGGGLFTSGVARLIKTAVSGNQAHADNGTATGGGVQASTGVYLGYSAISGNIASAPGSSGGGIDAQRYSYVYYSTIDHNQSVNNAAMAFTGLSGAVRIGNSTVSTNAATSGSSAMFSSIPTFINNCTIAFNTAAGNDAGLYFYPGATLDIESTIVSNNSSATGTSFDFVSRGAVTGSHNLIMNPGSAVPGDTLTGVDPELEPLAANFSLQIPLTHALAPASPAIDRGSNPRNFTSDERGFFHERVFGIAPDIGAYEYDGVDNDAIFQNGFD